MATEMLDVVDPATGQVVERRSRDDVHRLGLWHQVFHCLIVRSQSRSVLLQERSPSKVAFPGKLDLSATGHLESGETPLDGVRELEEELGVDVDAGQLVSLGQRLLADDKGEGQNREVIHLYLLDDDRPLADYRPLEREVSGLVEVRIDELLRLLADDSYRTSTSRRPSTSSETGQHEIGQSDLVDGASGYWVVAAVMAKRFLDGAAPVAI